MVAINLLPPKLVASLLVEDVLSSYTLPSRRARRIRELALRRFPETRDLEPVYLFIDSLVEGHVGPEGFFSTVARPERFADDSSDPPRVLQELEKGAALTYGEIEGLLRGRIGEGASRTLHQLLAKAGLSAESPSPVTPAELEECLQEVAARLERVRGRLDGGGFIPPARRVGKVSFRGKELFELRGRYVSKVTDSAAQKILEAHRLGLSLTRAAGFAGVARDTVKRWWKAAGLESGHRAHNALAPDDVSGILALHGSRAGNASEAAKACGASLNTVLRYWREAGLAPAGAPAPLTAAETERVRAAHATFGGNATAAARALGVSPSTVRKIWKRAGIHARRPGRPSCGKGRER
jgi:DNA invertase Pin-like site-specific DNA recombinase